jgi:diadenosine tetraphosphate (Ap4A) HIT family hydrolase
MIESSFILDKKLADDTLLISDLKLCRLLLMNNKNYPWLILVPRKNNLKELIDLHFTEQVLLLEEINLVSKILQKIFNPDKLNIATLGNVVQQLHMHVIARFKNDISFPRPVWVSTESVSYSAGEAENLIKQIKSLF